MRGQGRVFRPHNGRSTTKVYWLDYMVRGERHRESSGTTVKKDALEMLRQRIGDRRAGKLVGNPDTVTFAELRQLVETQYQLDGLKTLTRVKQLFTHLARAFGADRAMDITPPRLDAYTVQRLTQGAARATVNRELAVLRRGFRLAVQKGLLATRPEFSIPQEANARTGFFEPEELAALLPELPSPLRPMARFAYLTGWRIQSEVLPLTWAQVDRHAGIVRLEPGSTKNGEGRTFPYGALPALKQLVDEQWAARDGLFVFHRRGQRIKDFYEAWHRACRRAAVARVNGREVVVRPALVDRIPHDFRRTAVRNLVRAGVPERVAMQLTGHKTRAVFERYNIVNERDLTDGVAKLAAAFNGKPTANNSPAASSPARVTSSVA
jgi:integrase